MKMPTTKKSNKKIIIFIAVLLLVGGGFVGYAWQQKAWPFNHRSTSQQEKSPLSEVDEDLNSNHDNHTKDDNDSGVLNKEKPYDGGSRKDTSKKTTRIDKSIDSPTIERVGQSGDEIKLVASFPANQSGECEATFSIAGGTTHSYRSKIAVSPSNYSCSFVIPTSNFSTSGTWSVSVVQLIGTSTSLANTSKLGVTK